MQSHITYDWMVGPGLQLKGLSLSLFSMAASFTRNGQKLYRSRQSLAEFFGYSERQVGTALQSLVDEGLLLREERRGGHRAYIVHESGVREKLTGTEALGSFEYFLKHSKPLQQEKTSCSEGEKSSSHNRKKLPGMQEEISFLDGKILPVAQEESSPHNIFHKHTDKLIHNHAPFASKTNEDLADMVLPIFYFKNNCHPLEEARKFVEYYRLREWKLSGGKLINSEQELLVTADNWNVEKPVYTGRNGNFMKAWKEVYKKVPANLKKDILGVKILSQSQASAEILCSSSLADWLDTERQIVELIFRSYATNNYKLAWKRKS